MKITEITQNLQEISPKEIEDLYLQRTIHKGSWTNPAMEVFSKKKDSPSIHLHIYDIEMANEAISSLGWQLPPTVKTVSYGYL